MSHRAGEEVLLRGPPVSGRGCTDGAAVGPAAHRVGVGGRKYNMLGRSSAARLPARLEWEPAMKFG